MNRRSKIVVSAVLVFVAGTVLADNINGVNINFVDIGSAGYAADGNGYGGVGYNYRISAAEISIEQFTASGVGSGNENFWGALGTSAPASKMSWHEAARYCNWLTSGDADNGAYTIVGGQVTAVDRTSAVSTYGMVYVMPTEDEWYKAAYFTGSGYSLYANGTSSAPVNGVDAMYGTSTVWTVTSGAVEMNNGTTNMMGNVWEWTESAFDGNLDNIGEDVAFRGGAYNNGADFLKSTVRAVDSPTLEHEAVGMRIVAIPEPGTISLMSLSTLSLFFTRTVRRRKLAGKSLLPVGREHLCDTFSTFEEWDATYAEVEDADYLADLKGMAKARVLAATGMAHAWYEGLNNKFWSQMVVSYERRMVRKKAIKAALKKKILDGFDAFLAFIMK